MITKEIKRRIEAGASVRKLAKEIGTSERKLKDALDKAGVKTVRQKRADARHYLLEDAHLIEELAKDMTSVELAKKWEVTRAEMFRFLQSQDIKCKPYKVEPYPQSIKDSFFELFDSGMKIAAAARKIGVGASTARNWILRKKPL